MTSSCYRMMQKKYKDFIMTDNLPTAFHGQSEIQTLQVISRTAQQSGLYPGVGSEQKIFMILLAAKELGVPPMIALNGGIWNIQGKIEISARLMNSLIRRGGHSIKIITSDAKKCTLLGKRSDGDSFECTFDIEEAERAGLAGRDVWKKYTCDMLYNRCMSRLARRLFPDVIGNCYVEGEIKEAKEEEAKQKQQDKKPDNMQFAEFEDITPEIDIPPPKALTLSEDQTLQISSLWLDKDIDKEFKDNFICHIKKQWDADTFDKIPADKFVGCINAMKANIEKNRMEDLKNVEVQ